MKNIITLSVMLLSSNYVMAIDNNVTYTEIEKKQLLHQKIKVSNYDNIISSFLINDKKGQNLLLLTSKESISQIMPTKGSNEKIDLKATYYNKVNDKWVQEWNIKDGVDCPGVDFSAKFLIKNMTVTDLNKDGLAEITVPYKMFCGGGVDSEIIKIIMRQENKKLALRGLSYIKISDKESMGGTYKLDSDLNLNINKPFKAHIENIWKKIYITSF